MKVEKKLKNINKAIEKSPKLKASLTKTLGDVKSFTVDSKNRDAFRFFRDHLDGEMASEVNYVYGIGGRMTVDVGPDRMKVRLYTDANKPYDTFELVAESVEDAS